MDWAMTQKNYSQRKACALVGIDRKSYRYASKRPDDVALRKRLRDLASERSRFGYRRLGLLLDRKGRHVNHKKLCRLYKEEKLTVLRRGGHKRARGTRRPMAVPDRPNRRWSLDFLADTLNCGRRFRILAVVDDFSRECLGLVVDTSISGVRVARELDSIAIYRWLSPHGRLRQRHGADLERHSQVATGPPGRLALHRARQADAEWLRRKLQRTVPRRVPQRAPVPGPRGGPPDHRGLADRLQRQQTPHQSRRPHARRVQNPTGPIA